MTNEELKPCPFCGEIPSIIIDGLPFNEDEWFEIKCRCDFTFDNRLRKDLIKSWNTRAKTKKQEE